MFKRRNKETRGEKEKKDPIGHKKGVLVKGKNWQIKKDLINTIVNGELKTQRKIELKKEEKENNKFT